MELTVQSYKLLLPGVKLILQITYLLTELTHLSLHLLTHRLRLKTRLLALLQFHQQPLDFIVLTLTLLAHILQLLLLRLQGAAQLWITLFRTLNWSSILHLSTLQFLSHRSKLGLEPLILGANHNQFVLVFHHWNLQFLNHRVTLRPHFLDL